MLRSEHHTTVHVDEVVPRDVPEAEGWRSMDIRFLLPEDVAADAGLCLFRAVFVPGARHERHLHPNAAEFFYVVRGRAAVGAGEEELVVEAGTLQVIPAGSVHWLRTLDEEVEVLGAYLGVRSLEEAGYEFVGPVDPGHATAR